MHPLLVLLTTLTTVCVTTASADSKCVYPGTCQPPAGAQYSKVLPTSPRDQWMDSGGFCGAVSIQTIALAHGSWISQDLIRKAAGPGGGHGDATEGYEILHTNINGALTSLGVSYDAFDYENTPVPQSVRYVPWMKSHLAMGHGVVWFVMCKGDGHDTYGIPNATYDHIEAVFGVYSNSPLNSSGVQADDVLVHTSDYAPDGTDNYGYFRRFDNLVDTTKMEGNCSNAQPGWGRNEMYPCLEYRHSFGVAILGNVNDDQGLQVSLNVGRSDEPDIRAGSPAEDLTLTVTCYNQVQGSFALYRFDGGNTKVPASSSDYRKAATAFFPFSGVGTSYTMKDPTTALSSSAVTYRCTRT